jgi:hypothetical protein
MNRMKWIGSVGLANPSLLTIQKRNLEENRGQTPMDNKKQL